MNPRVRQAGLLLLLLLQRSGRLGLSAVTVAPSSAAAPALISATVRQEAFVHLKRDGERERVLGMRP